MKNKYFYPIFKLKIKSWIKYWLIKKTEFKGKLSEILEGFYFTLNNTLAMKFNLFEIYGNSVQDGTPSPDNEVPILSSGDNGSINEKIQTRNLFNKNTITEGKYIDNNGNFVNDSSNFVSDFIKLLSINSNLSYCISATTGSAKRIGYYDNSKTFISRQLIFTTQGKLNIPENASYVRLSCYNDDLESLQLEIIEDGSTATPYVPHEEQDYSIFVQQPMRSIGDVRDCFVKKSDGWYERHCFGKVNQLSTVNGPVAQGFYFIPQGIKKGAKLLSTHQQLGTSENSEEWKKYDGSQMKQLYPQIHNGVYINYKADTKQEQINWWNSLNNILFYELETPLDLPCTEEQIEALENLPSTYKDFTIIQSEDETPAYLKIQYYKEG